MLQITIDRILTQDELRAKLRTTGGLTAFQWRWIHYLVEHPELHWKHELSNIDGTRMCCLGALCMLADDEYTKQLPAGKLYVKYPWEQFPHETHDNREIIKPEQAFRAGLFGRWGELGSPARSARVRFLDCEFPNVNPASLSGVNDALGWLAVATVCLTHPEIVFADYELIP